MAKSNLGQIKKDLPENEEQKKSALKDAMADIQKSFGAGSIMKLGEHARMNVSAIPTGSLTLDLALGIGGLPKGRIVEIYGPEASGKTTLALSTVAQCQNMGGVAAFIDAEHALDPVYAKKLGVDTDNLLISQPDYGEQALEITDKLIRSGAIDIIVIDSVAALVPREEIDGNMGDKNMALQARLMSQALRKLSGSISRTSCLVIFINQLRSSMAMYGAPETTTGGKALKFYASVRIDIRKTETITEAKEAVANKVKCKIAKNKVAPPFKVAEFVLTFGEGIDHAGEILELATTMDIIKKSGSWFSYNGERIGQGKEAVAKYFKENKDLAEEIEKLVRANAEKVTLAEEEVKDSDGDDDEVDPDDVPLDIVVEDFEE
ncbi:MAG: recombinase RecA [Oscillospiraceae bacterium]|nr:recombinase RecA [Oscillospiraceae bacterium]